MPNTPTASAGPILRGTPLGLDRPGDPPILRGTPPGFPGPLRGFPRTPPAGPIRRPAVFLDRDGTLVEEVPYLHDPAELALLPGVAAALAALGAAGYALVVATNQAGVARGYYDEAAVARVHRRLRALLAAGGARLDAVVYCPHHPDGTVAGYAGACRCRKPGPGMLEAAAERLGLDLRASFLIGNHPSDVGAALAAGATPLFVTTGRAAGRRPPVGAAAFPSLAAATAAVLQGWREPGPPRP